MPTMNVNGANLYYEESGSGRETVFFSHGLLFSGRMFDKQVAALEDRYRCVVYDHRGQGQSEVTASGYDMDTLAEDAAALITALECAPCHFVGLSMGGFVGLRLAIRRPELLRSLVLLDTSAEPEPRENVRRYRLLNFVARWFGVRPVADRAMPIVFGRTFLNDPERAAERAEWRARLIGNDRIGITRAVKGIVERGGVQDQLGQIETPTLVIIGAEDVTTGPDRSDRIHAGIAGSQLVTIPRAGHMTTVEQPDAVNAALLAFLNGLG